MMNTFLRLRGWAGVTLAVLALLASFFTPCRVQAAQGGCASCDDDSKVEIKFRAAAYVRNGSVSITLNGKTVSSGTISGDGVAVTSEGGTDIDPEIPCQGSVTMSSELPAGGGCNMPLTAMFKKVCGYVCEISTRNPDDSYGEWEEKWSKEWTGPSGEFTVEFQLRLRKEDDSEGAGDGNAGVSPPTLPEDDYDAAADENGDPSQIEPAGFSATIPLGRTPESGRFNAGSLAISGTLSPSSADLSHLAVRNPGYADAAAFDVVMVNNEVRQVKTTVRLADVQELTAGGFEVLMYEADDFTPTKDGNGLYPVDSGATPSVTYRIAPVEEGGDHLGGVAFIHGAANGLTTETRLLSTSGDGCGWRVVSGNGLQVANGASGFDRVNGKWERMDTEEVWRDGVMFSKSNRIWQYQVRREGEGSPVVESALFLLEDERFANAEDSLTTNYTPDATFLGRAASVTRPDGSWEVYTYYSGSEQGADPSWRGVRKEVLRPWNGDPATAAQATTGNSEVTTYVYTPDADGGLEVAEATTTLPNVGKIAGSRKISGIAGITNLIDILADAGLDSEWLPDETELEEDASERDASENEAIPSTMVHYVGVPGEGRPWDGRQFAALDDLGNGSVTGYELGMYNAQAGTFTPNTTANQNTGTDVRSFTVELRGSGLPAALEGTLRIAVEDAKGHPLREELYILDESESWSSSPATVATYEYPEFWPDGSVREVIRYHDGRVASHARQVSGTETVTWDEQGIETRTFTDALGRVTASVVVGHGGQPDRVTSYQHAGRATTRTVRGGPLVLTTSEAQDMLGRTISQTDETGAETVTTYPDDEPADRLKTLVTLPGGPTRETTRNLDGRVVSITGTAVVNEFFAYEPLEDGLIQTTRRLGAVDSARYVKTVADWAGREIASITPSPTESGEVTVSTSYQPDTTRVVATASDAANSAPVVFYYPYAWSSQVLQGNELDEQPNGILIPASNDRITETMRNFDLIGSVWWEVGTRKVYDVTNDDESAITTTIKRRLHGNTGGCAAQTIEVLPGGGTVTTSVAFDRQNKTRTETVARSDHTLAAVTTNVNGLVTLRTSHDSSQPTAYQHDGLGRITKETNPRGGVKHQTWRSDGKLGSLTVQSAAPTVYDYYPPDDPAAGRLWKVTNPKGMTTIYAYNDLGKIEEISGTAEYPRTYEYDAYGELWKLTTKYGQTPQSATTTWVYQSGTGLLARKEYADSKGTNYTYHASGKLASRTWARLNGSIVTTWSYNEFGDLTAITYTGDSDLTPDVTISSLDRLGRPLTITQGGIGSETLTYHEGTNAKDRQFNSASHAYLPGIGLRHTEPDAHGREMGLTETASSDTQPLRTVGYVWDDAGRMETVTDEAEIHQYAYHPNSSLIATIDSQDDQAATWFRESRLYDVSARLVSTRSDRVSGQTESPLTRYSYRLDDLNRREKVTLLDGSKWDYGYNERSEVESATRKDANGNTITPLGSTYTYDDLGNRLTSTSPVLGNLTYTPNQLNQYASIAVGNSRTAVGRAPAGDVTVNGSIAQRIGEIYYRQLTADNSSGPVWQAVNSSWSTASVDRHFWYPAATTDPEDYPLRYDWDGNLETDGRWIYTWDAENRLVQMETTEIAESAVHPYRKLRYAYDWQGRRIARTVWHGTRQSPAFHSSQRWLYDGWNPVTEFTATAESGVTPTRTITLTWGIDLSGTLQGAGGVGGLLACRRLTNSPATTHRPCFDGNGNVVGWLKHGDSALEARREYDPFGNPLVEEGTEPMPVGFSTKMRDAETGLLYYGYRDLQPSLGRWLSKDRIGERGGINLYGFVGNCSVTKIDYLGLAVTSVGGDFHVTDDLGFCCDEFGNRVEKIIDDFGGSCCPDETQVIQLRVRVPKSSLLEQRRRLQKTAPGTENFPGNYDVGHTSLGVEGVDGSVGFFPSELSMAGFLGKPGVFGPDDKDKPPTHLFRFVACPQSFKAVQDRIAHDKRNPPRYFLKGPKPYHCTTWACDVLEDAGATVPKGDTPEDLADDENAIPYNPGLPIAN